jgi:hypothetical protein
MPVKAVRSQPGDECVSRPDRADVGEDRQRTISVLGRGLCVATRGQRCCGISARSGAVERSRRARRGRRRCHQVVARAIDETASP